MEEIIIKVINESPYPLPEYSTPGSAGMDLRANISQIITLKPLQRTLVPTGLYLELPEHYEAQIRPRSGLAIKNGLTLLNTPGTIDADYRGEIRVIMVNLSETVQEVHPGQRIAQMVISSFNRAKWEQVPVLSATPRGEGGFGHTGTL